ncbi:ABC transporter permease [Streptomyces sp. NPDC049916]|uniref:ABC transporter permease n=1 Tax=Streptomyces sp. NPDC049916 TaxID=3155156 RepID=UPI003434EAB9
MTTSLAETAPLSGTARPPRFGLLRHSVVLAQRSLVKTSRNPGPIMNGIITPALFMVLFLYLFGRPVAGTTGEYLQYLFPGILVMGAGLAGMISTGSAINLDLKNGVTDRFRSLPISRTAPLLGSVLADIFRYLIAVAVLFGIGALLGFRFQGSALAALGAAGLAILFGFCLSWLTVFIGVLIKSAEAVLSFSFIAFLPLQLGSSLAAPVSTLPGWLRAWADINPVTHVMDACRALLNGTPDNGSIGLTLLWSAILFTVFCPLAVRAYSRQE